MKSGDNVIEKTIFTVLRRTDGKAWNHREVGLIASGFETTVSEHESEPTTLILIDGESFFWAQLAGIIGHGRFSVETVSYSEKSRLPFTVNL